ncbi:PREDICTED: V-type [Prunus dulcis]|uniref:PREDICTED: V-type n=2 Tax=Prunus dulcis TaxID=3755 RepID=A0A5E4EFJ3_PRUDU|nr:PREDICTED: V-type [Prunus dulcis]
MSVSDFMKSFSLQSANLNTGNHDLSRRNGTNILDKMNDADVSKQIQQMVRFIRQEAEEKANEISVSAEEEFNIEKLQIFEADKKKIKQEYDRKAKQVDVRKKIEYSMQLNASRIKVLQAQDDIVNSMKEAAGKDLLRVSDDNKAYKKLIKDLIVLSLMRLKEPAVLLRCREVDKKVVESVLEEAKKAYADKASASVPKVTIDDRVFLPPPPKGGDSHEPFCSGGVVLASQDGKIVCENTLDARLDVVFRQKLPEIRKHLLGQNSAS